MHPSKKGSVTRWLLPHIHTYRKSLIFVTSWYCTYNSSTDTNVSFLSRTLWLYRSCDRLLLGDWHFNYLSKLYSSELQSKVYLLSTQVSNQSSHLIVTVEFIPFWGHLQLDHPVNVKISNVTIIFKYLLESKVIIFLITFFL